MLGGNHNLRQSIHSLHVLVEKALQTNEPPMAVVKVDGYVMTPSGPFRVRDVSKTIVLLKKSLQLANIGGERFYIVLISLVVYVKISQLSNLVGKLRASLHDVMNLMAV